MIIQIGLLCQIVFQLLLQSVSTNLTIAKGGEESGQLEILALKMQICSMIYGLSGDPKTISLLCKLLELHGLDRNVSSSPLSRILENKS